MYLVPDEGTKFYYNAEVDHSIQQYTRPYHGEADAVHAAALRRGGYVRVHACTI